jgi:hypothetical protein
MLLAWFVWFPFVYPCTYPCILCMRLLDFDGTKEGLNVEVKNS